MQCVLVIAYFELISFHSKSHMQQYVQIQQQLLLQPLTDKVWHKIGFAPPVALDAAEVR